MITPMSNTAASSDIESWADHTAQQISAGYRIQPNLLSRIGELSGDTLARMLHRVYFPDGRYWRDAHRLKLTRRWYSARGDEFKAEESRPVVDAIMDIMKRSGVNDVSMEVTFMHSDTFWADWGQIVDIVRLGAPHLHTRGDTRAGELMNNILKITEGDRILHLDYTKKGVRDYASEVIGLKEATQLPFEWLIQLIHADALESFDKLKFEQMLSKRKQ